MIASMVRSIRGGCSSSARSRGSLALGGHWTALGNSMERMLAPWHQSHAAVVWVYA